MMNIYEERIERRGEDIIRYFFCGEKEKTEQDISRWWREDKVVNGIKCNIID